MFPKEANKRVTKSSANEAVDYKVDAGIQDKEKVVEAGQNPDVKW